MDGYKKRLDFRQDRYCQLTAFHHKVLASSLSVINAVAAGAVVGLGIAVKAHPEKWQPSVITDQYPHIITLTTALIVIGAVLSVINMLGCCWIVCHNGWLIMMFFVMNVILAGSQLGVSVLTLFIKNQVAAWVTNLHGDMDLETAYERAFTLTVPACGILLAAIAAQVVMLYSTFKVMRHARYLEKVKFSQPGSIYYPWSPAKAKLHADTSARVPATSLFRAESSRRSSRNVLETVHTTEGATNIRIVVHPAPDHVTSTEHIPLGDVTQPSTSAEFAAQPPGKHSVPEDIHPCQDEEATVVEEAPHAEGVTSGNEHSETPQSKTDILHDTD